jgi:deoxyribonucleoside regulator
MKVLTQPSSSEKSWSRLGKEAKVELLVEIARAYYEQDHDQGQIAESLGLSRSQVSRYLRQARELNLVQFRVIAPNERMPQIEIKLKERFRTLREAVVAPVFNLKPEQLRSTIARFGANYLEGVVRPGVRICVGSGRTLHEVCKWLRPAKIPNISIVQAMGNVGHEAMDIDFNQMARAIASAFGAKVSFLNSPAILGSGTVKELRDANPMIDQALRMAHTADIYLFGVGSLTSDLIFTRSGIFKTQELEELQKAGSVGDICARFFDIHGVEIHSSFQDRIVGITLDDLRSEALTIAVAGSADKTQPLTGALNGGFVKVLVTDEHTALAILDYPEERR